MTMTQVIRGSNSMIMAQMYSAEVVCRLSAEYRKQARPVKLRG
jgi:hypothetical protein